MGGKRILKILENKGNSKISFCPGVCNPSDLPSRGCEVEELTKRFDFWLRSTDSFRLRKDQWPKQPSPAEKVTDENTKSAGSELGDRDVTLTQFQALLQKDIEEENIQVALGTAAQAMIMPAESFLSPLLVHFALPWKIRIVIDYVRCFIWKTRVQKW